MDLTNPLLLPDVIQCVMSHMGARGVELCRPVSKIWNETACKVLQKRRVIVFTSTEDVRIYNAAMGNTTAFPHHKFELSLTDFTGLVNHHMQTFWNVFGPHITHLDFRQDSVHWNDLLSVIEGKIPNLVWISFKCLPRQTWNFRNVFPEDHRISNVKHLRILSMPGQEFGLYGAEERLTDLLKAFPNLTVLSFCNFEHDAARERVSQLLLDVICKPDMLLSRLSDPGVKFTLNNGQVLALSAKRLPLRKLEVTFRNSVHSSSFHKLMDSIQTTIEELKLKLTSVIQVMDPEKFQKHMERLSNLKSLKIENLCEPIYFVRKMGMLSVLKIHATVKGLVPSGFLSPTGSIKDHPELRTFEMQSENLGMQKHILTAIRMCFPNLTSLAIQGVDDDGLWIILHHLPFIQELILDKAQCTDAGITGIQNDLCKAYLTMSPKPDSEAFGEYRKNFYIGSLSGLRKVSISSSNLTDASIGLGFVDCKNLQEFKLESVKITDNGIIMLLDKVGSKLSSLDLEGCNNVTEFSVMYALDKLQNDIRYASAVAVFQREGHTNDGDLNRGVVRPVVHAQEVESFFFDLNARLNPQIGLLGDPARGRVRIRNALQIIPGFMATMQRYGLAAFRRSFQYGIDFETRFFNNETDTPHQRNENISTGERIPDAFVENIYRSGLFLRDIEIWLS